ncbi:hypothetical protein RM153_21535 (plasmid) [Pantoea agglomerans]|uniref:hypothetical protein n=1 Tax=Enterobacter agglomerans TaxID=549 RepID=UPI00289E7C73|nr:hypothetical protein [Pantoea agglomerans]WNK51274.1 hypothetical protein RM153_21535 [Pantoea agglomerans]
MSDEHSKDWPPFYPEEFKLPPEGTFPADGDVYRFVDKVPPLRSCFKSSHEESPLRHKRCVTREAKESVYGTSFWETKSAAIKKLKAFPEALGGKILAYGKLDKSMGEMKRTLEPEHITVWFKVTAKPHLQFKEAE